MRGMPRSRLSIFLSLTFLITWTLWWTLAALARNGITAYGRTLFMCLFLLGGSGPTIAAYISVLSTASVGSVAEFNSRLLKWRVPGAIVLAAFLIPPAVESVNFAIVRLIEPSRTFDFLPWYMFFPFFLMMILGGGLEELGWRGVALPELQNSLGPICATVILGAIWSLWHLPLFFIRGVNQYATNFYIFSLAVTGLAFVLTWIYNRTRSILLCVLLHAAYNATASLGLKVPGSVTAAAVVHGMIWAGVGIVLLLCAHAGEKRDKPVLY